MNCGKIKKACFIASSGGHWEELMCLRKIADAYDTFFVTEEGSQAEDSNLQKIYTLPQINRHEKRFFWHFFKLFKSALKILKKEKPDFVLFWDKDILLAKSFPFRQFTLLFQLI